ncbi:hypothetical protein [Brevundimonas sp. R86498]|uniref:hypothetical protein n=1 Tax=Brevundimonas sp. R86498 TaxID=3093845 RepID=UPI0037C93460
MTLAIPFRTLIHADWSVSPKKRWMARADFRDNRWMVSPTVRADDILSTLLATADPPLLGGFDFPIGLPETYGRGTGFPDFPTFLRDLDEGAWDQFRTISRRPEEISQARPFYPAGAAKGVKRAHLVEAHAVSDWEGLLRRSERATGTRRAACSIFWTLGGNQVGRGALSGWEEVLRPGLMAGAHLWPFDGSLLELAQRGGITFSETYPAEAYGHVGVRFTRSQSKRRQSDRRSHSQTIIDWAASREVSIEADALDEIEDGFGTDAAGEDRFDAMLGLMGMVEVVVGGRPERPLTVSEETIWEGWIMGQAGISDAE